MYSITRLRPGLNLSRYMTLLPVVDRACSKLPHRAAGSAPRGLQAAGARGGVDGYMNIWEVQNLKEHTGLEKFVRLWGDTIPEHGPF